MDLPENVSERIRILRAGKGYSQRELADVIAIAPSQLSRIEKGQTRHVSSDILIKLAKAFDVSSDYILGLPPACESGLSEGAVQALATRSVDMAVLSRLLEHDRFPYLLQMIKAFRSDDPARRDRVAQSREREAEKLAGAFLAIVKDMGV